MVLVKWNACTMACLLLLWVLPMAAQVPSKTHPVPARLLDMGLLFADYRWEIDVQAYRSLELYFGVSKWAEIVRQSQEAAWPPGLRSRDDRAENSALWCDMRVYAVRRFGLDKILLWVPAAENQQLPVYARPVKDLYFIMRQAGVEMSANYTGFPSTLEAQLDFLLKDYLLHFASVRDTSATSTLNLDGEQWPVQLLLEGARSGFVNRSFDGRHTAYVAIFPSTSRAEEAIALYEKLLQHIHEARFTTCPLVYSKEPNAENPHYARFFAYDLARDMDPRFKNLTLTLQLVKSFDHTARESEAVWYPMLMLR